MIEFERPDWHKAALCRGRIDEFFPPRGKPTQAAKAVCAECPVRAQCGDSGMREKFGIWGGRSEKERRKVRRQMGKRETGATRPLVAGCGTNSGYQRHMKNHERACPACKEAHAAYESQRAKRAS